tara:strand:- start:2549 stop:2782 length:234 start_codon:yes stop_codon:yes gene_type:complete
MPFLKTEEHTDKQQDRIYTISDTLNSSNVWRMLEVRLGIKLDTDSDIYHEIEEFILMKLEQMEEENQDYDDSDDWEY